MPFVVWVTLVCAERCDQIHTLIRQEIPDEMEVGVLPEGLGL